MSGGRGSSRSSKMMKKVARRHEKSPKLKIWDSLKMSPKTQQNTKNDDYFKKLPTLQSYRIPPGAPRAGGGALRVLALHRCQYSTYVIIWWWFYGPSDPMNHPDIAGSVKQVHWVFQFLVSWKSAAPWDVRICVSVCMCVCFYVCASMCVYVCVCMYVGAYGFNLRACLFACSCVCMYVYVCMCVCVCICVCVCACVDVCACVCI